MGPAKQELQLLLLAHLLDSVLWIIVATQLTTLDLGFSIDSKQLDSIYGQNLYSNLRIHLSK